MLIILYGDMSRTHHGKQQRMIDGGCTCGYREYARNYGHIIYLAPQKVSLPWEHSMPDPGKVIRFISKHPDDTIVWSVKYSPRKDSQILSRINNKKVYYSCNARNMYNRVCHVSLVDTPQRVSGNAKLWFKGKDPNYWKPSDDKEFDYLLIGRRDDKNERYFLKRLNEVKEPRRILWIGGEKHKDKIKTNHEVVCTDFIGQDEVRDNISKAKVGILFTELSVEGFPQSFLELTMCGLPTVYNINAPRNKFYFHKDNCILSSKKNIVRSAETLLEKGNPVKCRETAIEHYSLKKSYERIKQCLK